MLYVLDGNSAICYYYQGGHFFGGIHITIHWLTPILAETFFSRTPKQLKKNILLTTLISHSNSKAYEPKTTVIHNIFAVLLFSRFLLDREN